MNSENLASAFQARQQVSYLIERERYAQASNLLASALAQFPQDADLLFQSAQIDYLSGAKDEAFRSLQHLLTTDPLHFNGRALMARLHEDRGELPAAELLLIELLKEYPENAWLYARYAMLMYRTLHFKKGRALAQEAFRLDPDSDDALIALMFGDLIEGRAVSEKHTLAELIRKHPENLSTAYMLVTHLSRRGQYRAAKRIAVEILHMRPHSKETLELVVQLDHLSHWSMLPLWPLNRWGWTASAVFYVVMVLLISVVNKHAPQASGFITPALLGFVVYSWVYPPLLKRWLMRRAGV